MVVRRRVAVVSYINRFFFSVLHKYYYAIGPLMTTVDFSSSDGTLYVNTGLFMQQNL